MTSFQDINGLKYAQFLPSRYIEPSPYTLIDSPTRPKFQIRVLSRENYNEYKQKIGSMDPLATDYRMVPQTEFKTEIINKTGEAGFDALTSSSSYDNYIQQIRNIDSQLPTSNSSMMPVPYSQPPKNPTIFDRVKDLYPEYLNKFFGKSEYGGKRNKRKKTRQNRKQRKTSNMRTRKSKK